MAFQFWRKDKHYFVRIASDQMDAKLGLAVSSGRSDGEVAMICLPSATDCDGEPVDEETVRRAVLAGIAAANQSLRTDWHPLEIAYFQEGSNLYASYYCCARLLIERINEGWTD